MTDRAEAYAAKRLVSDETFQDAVSKQLASLNKQLLTAKTPEDREKKFQEYDGLRRVKNILEKQALETRRFEPQP